MVVAAIAAGFLGGCSTRCRGPGCEDDFQRSTIAVLPGPSLLAGESLIDDLQTAQIVGNADDGVAWALASHRTDLLVGVPEARRVDRLTPPDGIDVLLEPQVSFTVDTPGFGTSVATVPTAAGFDLWVGSPDHDEARGGLWRFPDAHTVTGPGAVPDLLVTPSSPSDRLGTRVERCGDLTGDGVDDVAVVIPWLQPPAGWSVADPETVPALAGAVAILDSDALAAATGEVRPWDVGTLYWGAEVGAAAGAGLHCRTDLDADGEVDLVVGAPHAAEQAGEVYILRGPVPASGALPDVAWRTVRSPRPGAWFGEAVDAFEWSGQTSLIVGAPGSLEGRGTAWLYRATGLANEVPAPIAAYDNPRTTPDHVGRTLAHGDLDGDGRDEFLLGAPDLRVDSRTYGVGQLWVFGPDQPLGAPLATALGVVTDTQPFRRIGREVHVADLDGDSIDEVYAATRVR